MPRPMPRFDQDLIKEGRTALGLARAGEIVRAHFGSGSVAWREWPVARLEALYELAFLRIFIAWEEFLEASFYRYMCGYASARHGQAMPIGVFHPTLLSAEAAVLGGQPYKSWYKPSTVVARSQVHMSNGRHEIVINSSLGRLGDFAAIRHRIAHHQSDARAKFDSATLALAGRTYPASRPGRFLRDWHPRSSPPTRWLETIIGDLVGLATQIV